MSIEKIQIENFTVFEKLNMEFNEGINIFIGENGTGKTHLLKLMYAMCIPQRIEFPNVLAQNFRYYFGCKDNDDLIRNKDIKCKVGFFQNDNGYVTEILSLDKDCDSYIDYQREQQKNRELSEEIKKRKDETSTIFIPAKDMLTHSKGLIEMMKKYSKEMPFDKTLLDIIEKSKQWKLDQIPDITRSIIPKLEKIIGGKVLIENDTFYVQKENGQKIEFSVEAEGIKKIGLLWKLLMNESITNGTVLLWDEPESNINPRLIPDIVEVLLELSRNGVQIFIATHDYFLPSYFDVLKKETDVILFHSLYKTEYGVQVESEKEFDMLENNSISKELIRLYKEGVKKVME